MENEDSNPEVSERKVEANRRNAQQSTGPKTVQGKRNSSRNATKHGLLSRELVIRRGEAKENAREWEQLLAEVTEDWQPEGRTQLSLVEFIASCDWRLRRGLRAETAEIESGIDAAFALDRLLPSADVMKVLPSADVMRVLPSADVMNKILRYQTAIHRQKMQAIQLLAKLQERRRNRLPNSGDAQSEAEEK